MRDYTLNRIPDLTERYPEGFGGIDTLAPRDPYESAWDDMEREWQEEHERLMANPFRFEVGQRFLKYGWYGGMTYYTVSRITKDRKRILLKEEWHDVDGTGTRPAKWHDVDTDEHNCERAIEWVSKHYGTIYITMNDQR